MRLDHSYIGIGRLAAARIGGCLIVLAVAVGLGGCSTSIPLPSLVSDGDVTGSIRPASSPLSNALDSEDWRRAQSALSVALDPQGNGAAVNWDDPASGVKGAFIPVGDAVPDGEKICRAFSAKLGGSMPTEHLQGLGCRDKSGEWTISDVKLVKKA